jgi:aminoglycoside phosphotransferase (APT) family kinase protein
VTQPDHVHAGRSEKLVALLGLPVDAAALVVGDLAGWQVELVHPLAPRMYGWHQLRELEELATGSLDLVVVRRQRGTSTRDFSRAIQMVSRALRSAGSMVVITDTRFGLRSHFRLPVPIVSPGSRDLKGYARILASHGLVVHRFLPLPSLEEGEEFIRTTAPGIQLPTHAGRLLKVGAKLGKLEAIYGSGLLIGAAPGRGLDAFRLQLTRHLEGVAPDPNACEITRFDLRGRGSLIVMLTPAEGGGSGYLARVTTDADTTTRVRRNAEWTGRIHSNAALSSVHRLIPRPAVDFVLHGTPIRASAFIENAIPGAIAWKLAGTPSRERVLFAGAAGFLRDLLAGSVSSVTMDEASLDALLDEPTTPWVDTATMDLLRELRSRVRERLTGKTVSTAIAHGDFGYGNLLANPRTGEITGVIDWDHARVDVAGTDLVNFLVQRARGKHQFTLPKAFEQLVDQMNKGAAQRVLGIQLADLVPTRTQITATDVTLCAALRMAERSTAYPALFQGSARTVRELLQIALRRRA